MKKYPYKYFLRKDLYNDPKNLLYKVYIHFINDSLYRNSIYLMLSTAVMAFFGFFFWIICAHLYDVEKVGIATNLISVTTLFTSLCTFGLNVGLIRYLPQSSQKNDYINVTFTINILGSLFASIIFLYFLKYFSPQLIFINNNIYLLILFTFFNISTGLNALTESVFIAYRSSGYILIKNTIISLLKLLLPVILISYGAFGIFSAVSSATTIAIIISILFLNKNFNYKFSFIFDLGIIKKIGSYSFGNYIAGMFHSFPAMILPLIITNNIGAKESAYFYMPMMIANLLYIIPVATSQSLFAEGSHNEVDLKRQLKKGILMIFSILIPSIFLVSILGKYILLAFGKKYAGDGLVFLQILSFAGLFMSINYLGSAILNIKKKSRHVMWVNILTCIIIICLSYQLIFLKLVGIGIAWILGNAVSSILYILLVKKYL